MGMVDKYLGDTLNKDMQNRMAQNQSLAGGEGGGGLGGMLGGLTPMSIASGSIDGIAQIGKTLAQGNFNYGGDYTMKQAQDFGYNRGSSIAGGIMKTIPVVGGILSPIAELFGGLIAKKIAERKAKPVLENREAKMDALADFKKEKIRENRFFRESDLEYGADGSKYDI